jgi:hypothetical protein
MSIISNNLVELVQAMHSEPTTNQWDIVCSYNVEQLNNFLLAQYDAGSLAREIQLSTDREDPLSGSKYTIRYHIQFASPKLSFVSGRSGYASLIMPIIEASSYSILPEGSDKPTRTIEIPAGKYSIHAIVPLAAICGDTGKVVEQGGIIEFNDSKEHDTHVIIHFRNEKGTTYAIKPDPEPKDRDPLVTYFLPVLSEYFQTKISENDYALSTLNNKVPSSGQTVLTPSSFVFTSMGDDEDGVLSLYIQTKESGNPPGSLSPAFQPNDQSMSPIPIGYSASLILSNSLVNKVFLQSELAQLRYEYPDDTGQEGIVVKPNPPIAAIAGVTDLTGVSGPRGPFIHDKWEYKQIGGNFEADSLHLEIQEGELYLHWRVVALSSWSDISRILDNNGIVMGEVRITVTLNKGPIPITLDENDIIRPVLNVTRGDFILEFEKVKLDWDILGGERSIPPLYSQELPLIIPSIYLEFHGLNFLNTTNLLAPGKHMIQFDKSQGIKTPYDFIIVGQVVQGEG